MNNDIEFDLPGFLHSKIYPHMETMASTATPRKSGTSWRSSPDKTRKNRRPDTLSNQTGGTP